MGPFSARTMNSKKEKMARIPRVTHDAGFIYVICRETFRHLFKDRTADHNSLEGLRELFEHSHRICHYRGSSQGYSELVRSLVGCSPTVTKSGEVFRSGGQICKDNCL